MEMFHPLDSIWNQINHEIIVDLFAAAFGGVQLHPTQNIVNVNWGGLAVEFPGSQ